MRKKKQHHVIHKGKFTAFLFTKTNICTSTMNIKKTSSDQKTLIQNDLKRDPGEGKWHFNGSSKVLRRSQSSKTKQ